MKKFSLLTSAGVVLSCISLSTMAEIGNVSNIVERLYPRFGSSWVGDPMPFNNNGTLEVFYLDDARFGSEGFHPWHRTSTKDFITYADHGEVIPFVEDLQSQELALGTGSVIKVGGIYHAFYTAHNKNLEPYEAIMHATSADMQKWSKHPSHKFFAPDQYEKNDFRDPHVVYIEEEKRYWMLVTARKDGRGVIAKLTSKDLINWKDEGILFENDTVARDSNLECPTLIQYGDFWYLSFSDQWPDRVTQYRIADNPNGPFRKPEVPAVDGRGFYAGKLEQMNGHLYMAGWTPSKQLYQDNGEFAWAGNLVIHQLRQEKNGQLYTQAPEQVEEYFQSTDTPKVSSTTNLNENALKFEKGDYQVTSFGKIEGITKIEGVITTSGWFNNQFGITFNVIRDRGRLNITFDKSQDKIFFYNVPLERAEEFKPQITIDHKLKENSKFTIYIDDSVLVMYVDDEIALSTRMYRMQDRTWGIFSNGSNVEFSNLTISKK